MSLANVASRLAAELADLRQERAALAHDLAQATAELATREARIGLLVEQLEATGQGLETTARRAAMAELAHASAEASLGMARAEAATLRAERDASRRAAWVLTGQLGALEGALATGWPRRAHERTVPNRPEGVFALTVALGLTRAELPSVIRMVRAEAARTPLLLLVDHDLDERQNPAPAHWLRLPARRELPRRVTADPDGYLRRRVAALVQTLRPATVVPLGPFAANLLGPVDAPS